MTAIFGIFDGDLSQPSLAEMQQLRLHLANRGSSSSGIWTEANIALGNCLSRTTPESMNEQLPAGDIHGVCIVTADARLDNRKHLISELSLTKPPGELADSTLILESYRKWGEACPAHLLGDFAFAIWDRRTRKLFCARDHFGVKPFYYAQVARRLAFCTCIDGLLKLDWIPRRLNEQRLASHLTTFYGDTVATFYSDILRLPPAHSLSVDEHGARVTKYWTLNPECTTAFNSEQEYLEAFTALFREAVDARLRSSVRIGSMLSGGLDSSSISAMAGHLLHRQARGPLHTFSAVFDDVPISNEREFIDAAVKFGGFDASYLAADQRSPFSAPPELETQAEAHIAANMFLNWGLYDLARERGVRVLLDGFDGDTTISHGVAYLLELARANRWVKLSRLIPAAARICGRTTGGLWWDYLWHQGVQTRLPFGALRICNGVSRRWRGWRASKTRRPRQQEVLNQDFVRRIGLREYRASLRSTALPSGNTEKEAHYRTILWGVMPATLEMLQQTAAPFGIELRFPFWDRRLVEFCLGLPPEYKIRDGFTRWILRRAMEGILPREVQWRPGKSNIGPAFKHCLFKHGRELMESACAKASNQLQPYVCRQHLEASRSQPLAQAGDEEMLFRWQMANLCLWLEKTRIQA